METHAVDRTGREIRIMHDGQFRVVYLAKFVETVHVLYAYSEEDAED